ncbi:hypothetical protein GCM10022631_15990 [Deinococcus rubellus]|uniref:DUF4129 domain-containing protein n=1 Tax=Deinococcus rubellus TaxID=1889240 RepID=A0ABY5YCR1_9DEIO|nr:DUF4129 domain-containing protein [Deinococcus rubellus]UWX62824.1 DUF4129 domain-containing protein [Deinococcus rubellus]
MLTRPLLLACLPWTALGWQPWWLCLLQSGAVAFTVSRRERAALPPGSLFVSLLLLALLGTLTHWPDLKSAALTFVVTGPLSLLLAAGIGGAQQGQRWALAIPAALLLLGPTWLGVLGLLLGALGLGGPDRQAESGLKPQGRPGLGWPMLLTAAVALLTFALLPRPALPHLDRTPIDVVQRVPDAPASVRPPAQNQVGKPRAAPRLAPDRSLQALLDASSLPLLGMALLCLAVLWRMRPIKGQPLKWWALLPIVGLLAAAGLFVLGLLLQPQPLYRVVGRIVEPAARQVTPAGGGAGRQTAPLPLNLPTWLIWTVAALSLLLLLLIAWAVLRLRELPDDTDGPALTDPPDGPTDAPTGRVRAAYAATLHVLAHHGLSRLTSETPDELLSRAAVRWPEAAAPLAQLTGAYSPVRYGQAADESQAEAAEHSAAEVQSLLDASPVPDFPLPRYP